MNIARWEPFWLKERPNVWGRVFGDDDAFKTDTFVPAVDIKETDAKYEILAELPGVDKADVSIEVKDGLLTLTGERKFEREDKKENYTRIERSYGNFSRTFTLPDHVLEDKIEAAYKDGVLTVTLPKGEKAKPRRIDVIVQ